MTDLKIKVTNPDDVYGEEGVTALIANLDNSSGHSYAASC